MWSELESADPAQRNLKVKEALSLVPGFDNMQKRWESASKMRIWINEKKNTLSSKIQAEVEPEYRKSKAE